MAENIRKEAERELTLLREKMSRITRATDALHTAGNIAEEASGLLQQFGEKAAATLDEPAEKLSTSLYSIDAQLDALQDLLTQFQSLQKSLSKLNLKNELQDLSQKLTESGKKADKEAEKVLIKLELLSNRVNTAGTTITQKISDSQEQASGKLTAELSSTQKALSDKITDLQSRLTQTNTAGFKSLTEQGVAIEHSLQTEFRDLKQNRLKELDKLLKISLGLNGLVLLLLFFLVFGG
ncbi:MAG: hypothetical protein JJU35_12150 [Balneolales bacterium]|nr:hypothetical protein [Balneolales bacterium]